MYSDVKYGIHFLMGPTYYSALLLFLVKLAFKLLLMLRKGFKKAGTGVLHVVQHFFVDVPGCSWMILGWGDFEEFGGFLGP